MKIHPNKQFNKMLRNGTAKIINGNCKPFRKEDAAGAFVPEILQEDAASVFDAEAVPQNAPPAAPAVSEPGTAETAPECRVMELRVEDGPDGVFLTGGDEKPRPAAIERNPPPYVSFITFNRLGLTVRNLENLLDSEEDFELNIIDCNSKDNSWDYIKSLSDSRIKSKIRFDRNAGPIFALNYALSRRRPNQYFITLDSDTFIKTENWIARFMEVFRAFPDVGLLGLMRDHPYPRFMPQIIPRVSGAAAYLELKNADIETKMDFIPGHLQCLRPELIEEIGYWCEENGFGDAEIAPESFITPALRLVF
jgi:hypothetical protein